MTSGAIQYGVPMNVFLRPTVRSNWALTPKSTADTQRFYSCCLRWSLSAGAELVPNRRSLTQFDLCVLRQQNVLTLDVSVDHLVLVEVGQTLEETENVGENLKDSFCNVLQKQRTYMEFLREPVSASSSLWSRFRIYSKIICVSVLSCFKTSFNYMHSKNRSGKISASNSSVLI